MHQVQARSSGYIWFLTVRVTRFKLFRVISPCCGPGPGYHTRLLFCCSIIIRSTIRILLSSASLHVL